MIPKRIQRLEELAYNLWWSWDYRARALFRELDPHRWKRFDHNPVKLLRDIGSDRLQGAGTDPAFLRMYDEVVRAFDDNQKRNDKWFTRQFPDLASQPIAYFSAEFGLHNSLPIYSGGLGILSGDHCKGSNDLGIPLVAIGFVYPQGYFHQHVRADGWQDDIYELLNRDDSPIQSAGMNPGGRFLVEFQFNTSKVYVVVWQVNLGTVPLYLMDTDVEENQPWDRELSARLYGGDKEHRIRQEIVLGIGGVRVLRALGIHPSVWHANEGHSAFMVLERCRELVKSGLSFKDAAENVRSTTIFTTHTPVGSGHDSFPFYMIEKHFAGYWDELGLSRDEFLGLGRHEDAFSMTVLALRMADWRNGVSQLHGHVSRHMWRPLWPEKTADEVPITSVTNGVHAGTWLSGELCQLLDRYLEPDWVERHDDPSIWDWIDQIPDEEFWNVHLLLKHKLMAFIDERARTRWMEDNVDPRQVLAMGTLLDPEALTIGFARRFTGYKRASLIFHDLARIKSLLLDRWRPVQIIFAGKAHPADEPGKHLIHEIYSLAADHRMGGHVAFVENYDMHVAHFFTQGVDVWLNTPRPPLEACGTSGQKAAMNGALNFSILDGWWCEGYNGKNGWAIGEAPEALATRYDDPGDAESLYQLLEEQIIPLYYDRDERGIPRGWVKMAKESIRSVIPRFSTHRMLKEYATRMYAAAAQKTVMKA